MIYQHARYDCKLWNALWFYIIDEYSWLKYCISTKLSLIVYLIITDLSKCQMYLQGMERSLFLLRFLCIFIHYWRVFMTKVLYLYQTFTDCVSHQCWYVKMLDVTASYGTSFDFIAVFRYFHTLLTTIHVWSIVSSPNFHRLYV